MSPLPTIVSWNDLIRGDQTVDVGSLSCEAPRRGLQRSLPLTRSREVAKPVVLQPRMSYFMRNGAEQLVVRNRVIQQDDPTVLGLSLDVGGDARRKRHAKRSTADGAVDATVPRESLNGGRERLQDDFDAGQKTHTLASVEGIDRVVDVCVFRRHHRILRRNLDVTHQRVLASCGSGRA